MLADDDVAALCLVPGVGKKTAARLLIELQVAASTCPIDGVARRPRRRRRTAAVGSPAADVRDALAELGYGPDEIAEATRELPDDGDVRRSACREAPASHRRRSALTVRDELLTPVPVPTRSRSPTRPACGPKRLDEFVGQAELKEHLAIILEAARRRGQAADHLLLAGPPGLGKTTLAGIVAAELGVGLRITSGPALERAGDLAAILTNLSEGDVLFIDEIHRLARPVEEVLYPAMEDFQLDIVLGKGPAARSIRLDLPAVHARRRHHPHRPHHRAAARPVRARRPARLLRARRPRGHRRCEPPASSTSRSTAEGAREIARRSRGTPRIANRLLRRVRDFAEVRGDGTVDADAAREGLRAVRRRRARPRQGRPRRSSPPCASGSAAARSGSRRSPSAWASRPRPSRTSTSPSSSSRACSCARPRGRVATPAAWEHLGLSAPRAAPDRVPPPGLFG